MIVHRLAPCYWLFLVLGVPASAAAQPNSSSAVGLASGQAPAAASVGDDTRATPDFVGAASANRGTGDQVYRSSVTSADGAVTGHTVMDGAWHGEAGFRDPLPEWHVVEAGDPLWGISKKHLRDAYAWPKVWSYNDHVTNAHWIFPGDRIRLTDPYKRDDAPGEITEGVAGLQFERTGIEVSQRLHSYLLNRTAFVEAEQLESDMKVIGGAEAKEMMADLDIAFLSYPRAAPPIPGERLAVYTPQEEIVDPKSGEIIGYLVHVVGDVEIGRIARKAAEAKIVFSSNPIERGFRVGPVRRRFRRIDPVGSELQLVGNIVATVSSEPPVKATLRDRNEKTTNDDLIAADGQFVVVNLGEKDGVKLGNTFEVVRKGDEHDPRSSFAKPYEDGWPRRVMGTVLAVDVREQVTMGLVIDSKREFDKGDVVELGDSTTAEAPAPARKGKRVKAKKSGKASGSISFGK